MENSTSYVPNSKLKTAIQNYEYFSRSDLTKIVIPSNIKKIGERAFSNCSNLRKIIFDGDIEYIGAGAFSECKNLEEIVLPKSLKKLNYRTFADCKRLKKIVIPEGIEELEWGMFSGCSSLEEVVLPQSLKKIGEQLFLNCKKLKTVNIPAQITSLPNECFKGCHNVNISFPKQITELGNRTFEDCYKQDSFPKSAIKFGINCFRNCRNIKTAKINNLVDELPDGLFDGCINLTKVESDKKLPIGKRCFRNCTSLTNIPSFISCYNERAFENCLGLTSIDIMFSDIPMACFRGCANIHTINNQNIISRIDSFAFSGCNSIESFHIYNVQNIGAEAFSNCKKLKKVSIGNLTQTIGSRAFFNCINLTDFNLPDTIKAIKKEAFKNCHKIKKIIIPASLKEIGDGAFSYMNSLTYIDVSPLNKNFMTPDHKILINELQQKLVLYASGIKDTSYTLKNYNVTYDFLNRELIRPITGIGTYAFAGAKHLEELTLCSCTQDIEATAFDGCTKLKKLIVDSISLFSCPGFKIRDHGNYYFENSKDDNKKDGKIFLPFEEVVFIGDIVTIYPDALKYFINVKKLDLPTDHRYTISSTAFSDCSALKEVYIPDNIIQIGTNAFHPSTNLIFSNGLKSSGFVELIHNSEYIGDYKLFVFDDGIYYIEQNNSLTKITKEHIYKSVKKPKFIEDNPVLFLDFMNDLFNHDLAIEPLLNGLLMSKMSLENRKILFDNLNKTDVFFLNVLNNSKLLEIDDSITTELLSEDNFKIVIDYIELLRKYNITNPLLHNKIFMSKFNIKNFEYLIKNNLELFLKTIEISQLLEKENDDKNLNSSYYLTFHILQNNIIIKFIDLIKKYNIKDQYLFNKSIISVVDNPLLEELFQVYDSNIKRLLKASLIDKNNESSTQNLNDLLSLMKISGALEKNSHLRQRASTFISEKIFAEKISTDKYNPYRIVGDDIHRVFNFIYLRDEFDEEFAIFFLENYQELINEEKIKSGFIQRVYSNFRQISKTATSNKGSQRKLKVTIDKCRNYLSNVKFDGVTEKNKEFAILIGEWYDNNNTWLNAQRVYNESLKAPRNIFTKIEYDEFGNPIYDNDPKHDLEEEINPNYSYQWLPKQDYKNLILGKYCNCCAHIEGAGQGIMRASMILDNCQNLVVKNSFGEIIAKSTLYVNREENYAVFNNVETSINYRTLDKLENIYQAFLRGANAFVDTYNLNNPNNPIKQVSIGANRNTILDFLTDQNNHPEVPVQISLNFGEYSIRGTGYSGDWGAKQRLVLRKDRY